MDGHHHDLAHEFPEFKERIHQLKGENARFRKLAEEYEELDKAIARSEARIDLLTESDEEILRKKRLRVKEEIYELLKGA